jgi:hypothetical protein
MKSCLYPLSFLVLCLLSFSCADQRVDLCNGENLDNWTIFVSDPEMDPNNLFWVEDGMIQTAGKPNGYIRTKDSYSNFKLHLEWRWTSEPTNSGVLINVQGEDTIWPLAIECQLMHEHAGDIVLIGEGSGISVRDTTHLVKPGDQRYKVVPKAEPTSEYAPGEWNSYDITSRNGTLEVVVNGVLQNTGTAMTLTGGNILLQSEGSSLQFRNIYLKIF